MQTTPTPDRRFQPSTTARLLRMMFRFRVLVLLVLLLTMFTHQRQVLGAASAVIPGQQSFTPGAQDEESGKMFEDFMNQVCPTCDYKLPDASAASAPPQPGTPAYRIAETTSQVAALHRRFASLPSLYDNVGDPNAAP